jgi:hypothetical protein
MSHYKATDAADLAMQSSVEPDYTKTEVIEESQREVFNHEKYRSLGW